MPIIEGYTSYNFSEGNKEKILKSAIGLNKNNASAISVQLNFEDLNDSTTSGNFAIQVSNDGINFVTMDKFISVGAAEPTSFFIFLDESVGTSGFLQIAASDIAEPGKLKSVFIGFKSN